MDTPALPRFVARFSSAVISAAVLVGCTKPATPPAAPAPNISYETPDLFEKAAFEVLSDYYCERKSWPKVWNEVQEFQQGRGQDSAWLQAVSEPTLASPRAIFLSLSYKSKDGAPRRATYVAPPRCGKESQKGMVEIAAEGIVFELPSEFELLPTSAFSKLWRSPPYPDAAWTALGGRVLAVRFGDVEISPEELPQYAEEMAEAYEFSVPSLVWTSKESKMLNDRPVLHYAFQSATPSETLVNVVLSSVFDGRLFAISITGPAEVSDAVFKAAEQVEQSLRIR